MKRHTVRTIQRSLAPILVAVHLLTVISCWGATLADFGYQHKKVANVPALGTRPLLVLLVQFGGTPLAHSTAFYDSLVFGPSTQNMNGFFLENSNHRFQWVRAGVIGPLLLSDSERLPFEPNSDQDFVYQANIINRAMTSGLFDFRAYDTHGNGVTDPPDGVVNSDELEILIFSNDTGIGARPFGCVRPLGFDYSVCGRLAHLPARTDFASLCHEVAHTLGADDVYGAGKGTCLSAGITLMSCTLTGADNPATWHLDAWHKMQLGWCEPRMLSLREGGLAVLPVAQALRSNAPLILFDPKRGNDEFFMLEYRSTASSFGPGYDRDLASSGLAIWHVKQDGAHDLVRIPTGDARPGQDWALLLETAPSLGRLGNQLWTGGSTTPGLPWFDGSATGRRIYVHPYSPDANEITIEVMGEDEVWVDFRYPGDLFNPEFGTFAQPFNTVLEGTSATPWGGRLNFKSGQRDEAATFSRRMTVLAPFGAVTIGR